MYTEKEYISFIKLFKALPKINEEKIPNKILCPDEDFLYRTLSKGFIFSPELSYIYDLNFLYSLINPISKELGLSAEQMNASFHKSWGKVAYAPIEQLIFEQIIHYITTYGFESLGVYNKDTVYIPNEAVNIPNMEGNIKLTVIKCLSIKEIKENLIKLLSLSVALKEETVNDIVNVNNIVNLSLKEVEAVKNKEVKCILFDKLNILPSNPTEFLRFLIYKVTKTTLIIKNKKIIGQMKKADKDLMYNYLIQYGNNYGFKHLSKIFFRFKPLFLSLKGENRKLNHIINVIRKLADRYHKPLNPDYLNNITSMIKYNVPIDEELLINELSKVNTFRKIRLAYALNYRLQNNDVIAYKVRNGKYYSTTLNEEYNISVLQHVYNIILKEIIKSVNKNVKNKKVYIPKNIVYALPSSEKQFIGNIPYGSFVSVKDNLVVGINWMNYPLNEEYNRVDLDLKLLSEDGVLGWNSSYRKDEILFSGDMTDASPPNGASELFYLKSNSYKSFIITLNTYSGSKNIPYKIFVGSEKIDNLRENYMINPNNVIAVIKSETSNESLEKVLGIVSTSPDINKIIFVEGDTFSKHVSDFDENTKRLKKYLKKYYETAINLFDILKYCEIYIVDSPEEADVDLSLENLDKSTILSLLK